MDRCLREAVLLREKAMPDKAAAGMLLRSAFTQAVPGVAQPSRARGSGPRGRGSEARHPDHSNKFKLVLYGPNGRQKPRMKRNIWYIEWHEGRRRCEKSTGTEDYDLACGILSEFSGRPPITPGPLHKRRLHSVWRRAKYRPTINGLIECNIMSEDVIEMYERQGGRCAVTGIVLDCRDSISKSTRYNPYSPSIDRIDCREGYTRDNCRLVCLAANFAMNEWGEEVLRKIAIGYIAKNGCR